MLPRSAAEALLPILNPRLITAVKLVRTSTGVLAVIKCRSHLRRECDAAFHEAMQRLSRTGYNSHVVAMAYPVYVVDIDTEPYYASTLASAVTQALLDALARRAGVTNIDMTQGSDAFTLILRCMNNCNTLRGVAESIAETLQELPGVNAVTIHSDNNTITITAWLRQPRL